MLLKTTAIGRRRLPGTINISAIKGVNGLLVGITDYITAWRTFTSRTSALGLRAAEYWLRPVETTVIVAVSK